MEQHTKILPPQCPGCARWLNRPTTQRTIFRSAQAWCPACATILDCLLALLGRVGCRPCPPEAPALLLALRELRALDLRPLPHAAQLIDAAYRAYHSEAPEPEAPRG